MKFVAHTASIDENVSLLECKDVTASLSDDGSIDLSRNVVVVEGNNGVHGDETAVLVHTKLPLQNGVVIDGKLSVDGSVKQSIDQLMSSLCCNKTTAPITPNGSSE